MKKFVEAKFRMNKIESCRFTDRNYKINFIIKMPQTVVTVCNSKKDEDLPNLSSPKLPQPIFLPTRKFGPTMSTPDEPTECLGAYIPLELRLAVPTVAPPPIAPDGGAPL